MDYLGQSSAAVPQTYSVDELKNIGAYTRHTRGYSSNKNKYLEPQPFTSATYRTNPQLWVDLPRNHIEDKGSIEHIQNHAGNWGILWKGRAFQFKDAHVYLNGLKLIKDPQAFIRYLKLAPLAGWNVTGDAPIKISRGNAFSRTTSKEPYAIKRYPGADVTPFNATLPLNQIQMWWMEVITWDVLQMSFTMLRMAQIEDLPDLYGAYMNAGKYIDKLKADMRSAEVVNVLPLQYKAAPGEGFRVELSLTPQEISMLENGIKQVYALYNENRKKMAARIIELQNVDAKIVPTTFSTDPHQNPYLVYDAERSAEENRPIFTNIARNNSATWAPPEVAGRPENLQDWAKVEEYTAQHERTYASEYGPLSDADIEKYGLEKKGFNWVPWLIAGGAATYAATQML